MDFNGYSLLGIQNDRGAGLALEAPQDMLAPLTAGDSVEAVGMATHRAGLPVLRPSSVRKLSNGPAPEPRRVSLADLRRFETLGSFVTFEARTEYIGENAGGDIIRIGSDPEPLNVFVPRRFGQRPKELDGLREGDTIRVTGLSSIYSPIPPHDRFFQVVAAGPGAIEMVRQGWMVPPWVIGYVLLTGLLAGGLIWWRERLLGAQRRTLRGIMSISEDVLDASSPSEIVERLARQARKVVGASDVELFLFSPTDEALRRISAQSRETHSTVPVDTRIGTVAGAAALCFRNRSLLRIPDTEK